MLNLLNSGKRKRSVLKHLYHVIDLQWIAMAASVARVSFKVV